MSPKAQPRPSPGKQMRKQTAEKGCAAVCRHSPPPILTKGGFHKHPADALVNSEGPCGSASERFPVLLHKENALVISRRRVPAPPRLCGPSQPAASPPSPRRAQTGCSHSGPWSARNAPRPCSPFTHLRSWPETIDPRATWRNGGRRISIAISNFASGLLNFDSANSGTLEYQ